MALLDALRPPAPLGRHQIRVLVLLGMIAFGEGWSGNVLTHTLPFTQESFGLTDGGVAGLETVIRAVALLALLLSWWGDRRGRRVPLLLAFFVLPAANLATVFVPSLTVFALCQSLARVGNIAIGALALVVLTEEIEPQVRGYAAGVFSLFVSMGVGFGLLLSRFAEAGDEAWRILFGVGAAPLLFFPIVLVHLRESRAFRGEPTLPSLMSALRSGSRRYFWPMAGISFCVAAFSGVAANFILIRLNNHLGWDQGAASIMLVLTSTPAVLLGLLAGGRAADVVGRRLTEVVAMFIGVGGAFTFYFSEVSWVMGLGIFLSLIGTSAFAPAFAAQRSELFPTAFRSTATAWLSNVGILGSLSGFAVGYFIIDLIGLPITVGIIGATVLGSTSLVLLLPETRGADIIGQGPPAQPGRAALSG
jgi:MFS family permease